MFWDIVRWSIFAVLEILLFYYFVTRFISVVKFGVKVFRESLSRKDKNKS